MFFVHVILLLYTVQYSSTNRCPSSNYCICSSDLTIITCTNRKLTDQSLLNLNSQLPETTIILNLSSNSLTSINSLPNLNNLQTLDISLNKIQILPSNLFIKFSQLSSLYVSNNLLKIIPKTFNEISNINFDISNNPLKCTCQLKWLIEWFETINVIHKINCQKGKQLNENDFCLNNKNFLYLTPNRSQIVYQNDSLILNCSSNMNVFWMFNHQLYSTNSTIFIPKLEMNHSGLWTCHSSNLSRSISLHVLNIQTNHFCPTLQMSTSKGHFYWPRTLIGQRIQLKCPFKSAAWFKNSSNNAQAFYTCSTNRQWIDLDLSQCAFRTNISREFDRLLSINQTNILSKLITYISRINLDDFKFDDIIFLIDLIDEQYMNYLYSKKNIDELSILVYRLTDLILQIKQNFIILPEYQLALNRLRIIVERLLSLTSYQWIYSGKQLTAIIFQSSSLPSTCFLPNRTLLTIICGTINQHYIDQQVRECLKKQE